MNIKDILSVEEAHKKGHQILNRENRLNPNDKNIAVCCDLIAPKFKEFYVATSIIEIEETIEDIKTYPLEQIKIIWVNVLRNIMRYDADELRNLYQQQNEEWFNLCNEVVLWYCYNAILFKKGIPVVELK